MELPCVGGDRVTTVGTEESDWGKKTHVEQVHIYRVKERGKTDDPRPTPFIKQVTQSKGNNISRGQSSNRVRIFKSQTDKESKTKRPENLNITAE